MRGDRGSTYTCRMGIIRDFIKAMSTPTCEGCGKDSCNTDCVRGRQVEQDWQNAIK